LKALSLLTNKAVYVETFGCAYNAGDTRKFVEVLKSAGCTIVEDPINADAVFLNTCNVTERTERKILRRIIELKGKPIFLSGCLVKTSEERLREISNPTIIDPDEIREEYKKISTVSESSVAIIQIASGCTGLCSYCSTKLARGDLKSIQIHEILNEVRLSVLKGAVEIQLTAQDVSSWGLDIQSDLSTLLKEISLVPGDFLVRTGMMNPLTLKKRIDDIKTIFSYDKIARFLHMPVQSGSDTILAKMNRGYTIKEVYEVLATFRDAYPDITFITDMIVGFPGENEDDFKKSLDFISNAHPNKVNITRYSQRKGTKAENLRDTLERTKKERSREMFRIATLVAHRMNHEMINKVVPFIVTEQVKRGSAVGRTPSYQMIVLPEEFPSGYRGYARITGEKVYYFTANHN